MFSKYVAIISAMISLVAFAVSILYFGTNAQNAPIILQIVSALGILITALVAALKSSETASHVAEIKDTTENTNAAVLATSAQINVASQRNAADFAALRNETPHACHDPLCGNGGES